MSTPRLRLVVKSKVRPERVLMVRCAMLFSMVGVVMALFWFDRDGLKDQIDGHISFSDVAYFTAVTVTTVGYGDIVPVSDRARIMDAVLVTPLRLIIWLIFMGTAYELVLQRWIEEKRMNRLQDKLSGHVIICGFGHSGQSAAREAVSRGTPPDQILVIEHEAAGVELAAAHGHVCLQGNVTQEQVLSAAGIARANAVMLCLGRDDTTVLTTLTIRQLNPHVRVICAVGEAENIKLAYQAGANAIIAPSVLGGYLMTNSVKSSHVADYISDLMMMQGQVNLVERAPMPHEIGQSIRDIRPGLAVSILRQDQRIDFWESQRAVVQAGDMLLVIEATENQLA